MVIFRYEFQIDRVFLAEKHFRDKEDLTLLKDKAIRTELEELKGFPISILQKESEKDSFNGTLIAESRAKDKASEIIATMVGMRYGGRDLNADLRGAFVACRLVRVHQVE